VSPLTLQISDRSDCPRTTLEQPTTCPARDRFAALISPPMALSPPYPEDADFPGALQRGIIEKLQ